MEPGIKASGWHVTHVEAQILEKVDLLDTDLLYRLMSNILLLCQQYYREIKLGT